jgi:hypothetical protein
MASKSILRNATSAHRAQATERVIGVECDAKQTLFALQPRDIAYAGIARDSGKTADGLPSSVRR